MQLVGPARWLQEPAQTPSARAARTPQARPQALWVGQHQRPALLGPWRVRLPPTEPPPPPPHPPAQPNPHTGCEVPKKRPPPHHHPPPTPHPPTHPTHHPHLHHTHPSTIHTGRPQGSGGGGHRGARGRRGGRRRRWRRRHGPRLHAICAAPGHHDTAAEELRGWVGGRAAGWVWVAVLTLPSYTSTGVPSISVAEILHAAKPASASQASCMPPKRPPTQPFLWLCTR